MTDATLTEPAVDLLPLVARVIAESDSFDITELVTAVLERLTDEQVRPALRYALRSIVADLLAARTSKTTTRRITPPREPEPAEPKSVAVRRENASASQPAPMVPAIREWHERQLRTEIVVGNRQGMRILQRFGDCTAELLRYAVQERRLQADRYERVVHLMTELRVDHVRDLLPDQLADALRDTPAINPAERQSA